MKPPFEAKYINVIWADKDTVRSVIESIDSIEIEPIDDISYKIEVVTYSKVDGNISGQLAFHVPNYDRSYIPTFVNSSDEKIDLISIINNESGKLWWIENGEIKKSSKGTDKIIYRDSPLCRHVGQAHVIFGNTTCDIEIRAISFSYTELDYYLRDFRNDLWDLILKEDSYISADAKTHDIKVAKEELIKYLNIFIKFATNIIEKPKKELRENQSLQPAEKVRPIPRTFMEIATKGQSKLLTGRDYIESYDVTENRYIHAIIIKLSTLIMNLSKVSEQRTKQYKKNITNLKERLSNFSDTIEIDKVVAENSINELEEICKVENQKLMVAISENDFNIQTEQLQHTTIFIKPGKRTDDFNGRMQFWGDAKLNEYDEWYRFKGNDSYSFEFDIDPFNELLTSYYIYKITAYIEKDEFDKRNGGTIYKRYFKYISNIEIVYSSAREKLLSLYNEKEKLEGQNWIRPLTSQEITEQEYEKKAIERSQKLLERESKTHTSILGSLAPILSKINILRKQFSHHKIQIAPHFPGSMTFVRNPNYQGAHKIYKQVMNTSGLDENLFENLQETEKIGILDIPAVYERWCLLQITKVLIEQFHFTPEEGWKQSLLQQTLNIKKNIVIKFKNEISFREIRLFYEKEIHNANDNKNSRRPDFVLDVKSSYGPSNNWYRLVMDAKFYETIDISSVVNELYNTKNYSENKENCVFILHPSLKAIPKKKTPQKWSTNSFYGENRLFSWDGENHPDHLYGALLVSPIVKEGSYLDDLQRLIGMFLEYSIEDNQDIKDADGKFNPLPKARLFCLVCGGIDIVGTKKQTIRGYGYRYQLTCNDCHHNMELNYCHNCKNRLFKHGTYWSYHAMHPFEPFNIKCPHCGTLL